MYSLMKNFKNILPKQCFIDVKYYGRAISGDRLRPLNEDTLTGRFLLYLNNRKSFEPMNPNGGYELIKILKVRPREIGKFHTNEVISALGGLNDRKSIENKYEFRKLLHLIDTECCQRMNKFDVKVTLTLLHTFMKVLPHRIIECQYFNLAMDDLMLMRERLNKEELVQLIFFIGLIKKSLRSQNMLRQCIKLFNKDLINKLTKEDMCIVCNSTFKTSTKIKNEPLLDKIKLYLNDNLFLLKDPAVFVTLIKTIRHNRYQDEDLLATLTCAMFFNRTIEHYSFSAICHILALYSDFLYYDANILEIFSNKCLEQLKASSYSAKDVYLQDQPRSKDIKRFLWALSNLNFNLRKDDIESVIIPQIMKRFSSAELSNDPGTLIDIILYLWMMQYRSYTLIKHGLTKEKIEIIKAKSPNTDSLNLLLNTIHVEDQDLFTSLQIHPEFQNNYNMNIQLEKRPVLKKIVENLKKIALENDIDKYQICCQVPYINIIGITGFQKKIYKTVNIEVLDEYTCLKNTENMPTGLMQLKLRLLDKSDEGLVVIEATDIASCSDLELQDILRDEISLVC